MKARDVQLIKQAHPRYVHIITLWLGGTTCAAIGQELGVSKQRVHDLIIRILGRHGFTRARRGQQHLLPAIVDAMNAYVASLNDSPARERTTGDDHAVSTQAAVSRNS